MLPKIKPFFKEKKKIIISTAVSIFAIMMLIIEVLLSTISEVKEEKGQIQYDAELARAMTYAQVVQGEEATNSAYVNFDAFFLRDLNQDGVAEGVRGTCKKIGEQDILYMELNVLTNGRLENGVITINSDNFYLQTAIPKDGEIKNNVIGNNIKTIELNTINNATQKLLTGMVKSGDYSYASKTTAAIGNDTTKYSRVNSVTLSGTHISDDGVETPINKTINFNVDWYGSVNAEIVSEMAGENYKNQNKDISDIVNEEKNEINLDFKVRTRETEGNLLLKKSYIEGIIPELNGYSPMKVEISGTNVTYTYDEVERKFIAQREAILDDNNQITQLANDIYGNDTRYNEYEIKVTYPLEAYRLLGADTIELKLPVKTYYEAFNNPNDEFVNPIISNVVEDLVTLTFSKPVGDVAIFDVTVGKYMYSPEYRYAVSKEKPLKIYNGISVEETDDTYLVAWYASTGSEGESQGVIMKESASGQEQVVDQFITSSASEISMENITSNVGIYFSNPVNLLGEDGWINVYNDETNEVIESFNKDNWNNYSESNPYMYQEKIKHIRIETSDTNKNSGIVVFNIKELDDEYITTNFTKEEFDNLQYIKSTLTGYIGENYINTDINHANYEIPKSVMRVSAYPSVISTQETIKNAKISIYPQCVKSYNEVKWKNAVFLVEMPEDIIYLNINSVKTSNENVKIISYEKFEKNEKVFIKIFTENETEEDYYVTIDYDITPDPRMASKEGLINVYASNENAIEYYNGTEDIYDVNGNLNTIEKVHKEQTSINFVAPTSLLTSQTATNYDDTGSMVIAPQIAFVEKEQRQATININLTNNYTNTISEVKLLGRIPFEGNKYVISNGDMNSTYTTSVTEGGIVIPEDLRDIVTIYYSENEVVTEEIDNQENNWTTNPADYSKVKNFLIDFGEYRFSKGESHNFSYDITLPNSVKYNDISYSHHAVYFSLDTENGKYRTKTEPNKLGIMIAKKYNLQLTKNKFGNDNLFVPGATYSITPEETVGEESSRTETTNIDGKLIFNNLYAEKTYVLTEIKSPEEYVLNEEKIRYTTKVDENGELTFINLEGNFKGNTEISSDEGKILISAEVEDVAKYSFNINKTDENNQPLNSIKFKLTRSRNRRKSFKNKF